MQAHSLACQYPDAIDCFHWLDDLHWAFRSSPRNSKLMRPCGTLVGRHPALGRMDRFGPIAGLCFSKTRCFSNTKDLIHTYTCPRRRRLVSRSVGTPHLRILAPSNTSCCLVPPSVKTHQQAELRSTLQIPLLRPCSTLGFGDYTTTR